MKICFCIPRVCQECFQLSIEYCPQQIFLQVDLTPNDNLYLFIRDKFDNLYRDPVTVSSDGSIEIIMANFPIGMFTPSFGMIEIFVAEDENAETIVELNTDPALMCINLIVTPPVYFVEEQGCKIFVEQTYLNPFIQE